MFQSLVILLRRALRSKILQLVLTQRCSARRQSCHIVCFSLQSALRYKIPSDVAWIDGFFTAYWQFCAAKCRNKLLAVRDSVAVSLEALQEGLKRRAETSAAREMLELLLDTSHVVSKVNTGSPHCQE
jgi:hypothetical protein